MASGRGGAKTLLVEVNGCLGGIWTAGLMPWVIDHANKGGLMSEFKRDLAALNALDAPPLSKHVAFDVETLKHYLERKCLEAGVDVLLRCRVVAAVADQRTIEGILTESKSGRQAWRAKRFVDATGDGDLAAFAGCDFDYANPDSGLAQPMSMIALLTGVDFDEIKEFVNGHGDDGSWKTRFKEELSRAGVEPSYGSPKIFRMTDNLFMLMANHQYQVSAFDAAAVSRATIEGRAEINELVAGLRSLGGRWRNLRLAATAERIGIREGRRIKGIHTITADDIVNGVRHDDAVCACEFGMDVHSPDPKEGKSCLKPTYSSKPYDIPMRALMSKDIDNLLMAGRCVSGDFWAHSSYRVTGNAVPMGEAAGAKSAEAALRNN